MKFFNSKKLLRGVSVICSFLTALCIGVLQVTEISDYKIMVNNFLGISSSFAGNADEYVFTSEYSNTTEMLTERQRIAEQLAEEGCVLLKNENSALPLRSDPNDDSELKVTVLGGRAYTYTSSGSLRDTARSVYGGVVGSPVSVQTVTTAKGKISLPVTLEDGLKNQNIKTDPALKDYYSNKPFPNLAAGSEANGSQGQPFNAGETAVSIEDCKGRNEYNDAAFVFIGRSSGEGREYFPGKSGVVQNDTQGHKSALGLSDDERNLVTVADAVSEKVIVLLNSAVAMEIDELKNDERVDAILWIGMPGSYGMNGVARIISGAASPSGRLTDAYAADNSASPAAQNFGVTTQDGTASFTWASSGHTDADDGHYVVFSEGIYTGYRYYETRYADTVYGKGNASGSVGLGYGATGSEWKYQDEVSYTFGYGLSYSEFEQKIVDGSLVYDSEDKSVSLQVLVKNIGTRTAHEVVQLYVSSPYTRYDINNKVEKSSIQLCDFEKVFLEPEEETTVTVTVPLKYFASYDKTVVHDGVTGGYIIENASYIFAIGNGAHEAINNVLFGQGVDESALYSENGAAVNTRGYAVWNPADSGITFDSNGVNATLLGKSDTGAVIQNQMENADYNYYKKGTVTYLTRSDWTGTFPIAYTGLTVTAEMEDPLNSKVYKFKTGTVSVEFGVDHSEEEDENGNPLENKTVAAYKLKAYDDVEWDYLIEQITFDEAWMLSPYGGTSNEPFKSVNAPEVWQIDGPNGNVSRWIGKNAAVNGPMALGSNDPNYGYMSNDMPIEPMIAATFNKELLYEEGEIFGEDGLWSRNTFQWAPGMNLHRTPFNARNHEYYSEDPMLTSICGSQVVHGALTKGMVLAAKHFAFNSQESFREGLCQFMEEQSARELELRGYEMLCDITYVNDAGNEISALGLMSSFSRVGVYGVNSHTGVMKNILRGEWGFNGIISTDMVVGGNFFNPQDSIFNNVTFMATSNPENLLNSYWSDYNDKNKVKNDPELMQAIYDNLHNYMYVIANSNVLNGIGADMSFSESGKEVWEYVLIGGAVLFGVLSVGGLTLTFMPFDKKRFGAKENKEKGDAENV